MDAAEEASKEAASISVIERLAIQNVAFFALLRALVKTHPQPEELRQYFDQQLGQHLAHPSFLMLPGYPEALRASAELLFRPAISIDDPQ